MEDKNEQMIEEKKVLGEHAEETQQNTELTEEKIKPRKGSVIASIVIFVISIVVPILLLIQSNSTISEFHSANQYANNLGSAILAPFAILGVLILFWLSSSVLMLILSLWSFGLACSSIKTFVDKRWKITAIISSILNGILMVLSAAQLIMWVVYTGHFR